MLSRKHCDPRGGREKEGNGEHVEQPNTLTKLWTCLGLVLTPSAPISRLVLGCCCYLRQCFANVGLSVSYARRAPSKPRPCCFLTRDVLFPTRRALDCVCVALASVVQHKRDSSRTNALVHVAGILLGGWCPISKTY